MATNAHGTGEGVDIFLSALGCTISTQTPEKQRRFLEIFDLEFEKMLKTPEPMPEAVSVFARQCMSRFRHALDLANEMSKKGRLH